MRAIQPMAPSIVGRVDWNATARLCWDRMHKLLRAWARYEFGFSVEEARQHVTPRWVIKWYEKNFKPREAPPPINESEFEIEHTGMEAGQIDGFRSSGFVRKGTIREIIEDIDDDSMREATHRLVDEVTEEEKQRDAV